MAGGRIDIPIEPDVKGFPGKLESGLKGAVGVAGKVGKGIAVALAAATAAVGFGLSGVIDKGIEYQSALNELQSVSQATALDMRRVADAAKALGSDMTLPATSAADAASAMVELAKGGLSVDEAMQAAKGTLQLAAAAQVDGATAAELQANALNSFGLSADQAGRVADVLANTANAAAGSMIDIGNSLKYVAPVSAALKVSIEDTAAAIGLLANQGIKGEQAGTSLRGILASLSSPSAEARKGLRKLNVEVFDAQGKFVGLRKFTDQLAQAKKRLTDAEFAAAASTAFGNEGFTAANALAAEGAAAFDEMAVSVSRSGGAADVAAAQTKGLGGAIEGFKSQLETAQIGIFEEIAPTIERGVRRAADVVSAATPVVVGGIRNLVSAGELFGPSLADAMRARGQVVGEAVRDVLGPIAETIPGILNAAVNAAIGLWSDFTEVLSDVVDAAKPVAKGIAAVAKAAVEADGPLSAAGAALGLAGDAAQVASGFLVPIGKIVGAIAESFAGLPGPVQSAVLALGLAAALKGPLGSMGDTVKNRVVGPFKNLGEEVRLQQSLLTGSTNIMSTQIGKVGLAMAALESRVPIIGKIAEAYRSGSTAAEGYVRSHAGITAMGLAIQGSSETTVRAVQGAGSVLGSFSGVVGGTTKAIGVGLRGAASGLVGFLGGPWGVALAAAGVGLSILAGRQQEAARRTAEHQGWVESLTQALRESNGAIDENVRRNVLKEAQDNKVLESAERFGIAQEEVTRAIFEGGPALENLRTRLQRISDANREYVGGNRGNQQLVGKLNDEGQAAQDLQGELDRLAGGFKTAQQRNAELEEAIRTGNISLLEATGVGRGFASAMGVLADNTSSADDKARALKEALDVLSGGEVDLEAAQSRLNEQMHRLSELFGENVDKTKGWGTALLGANGSINTSSENGRRLFEITQDIGDSMATVAQRTFDLAVKQGDDLPTALKKAKDAAQGVRDGFVAQGEAMGLLPAQIEALADHYGLVPDLVATAIQTPGMSEAQQELVLVRELVNKVPPDKPVTIRSLSDEAKKKLQDIGFTVTTLPDGQVKVTANTEAARNDLDQFIRTNTGRTITVKIVGQTSGSAFVRGDGGRFFQHDGGILAAAYAGGGVHRKLTPMRAGIAQIVPPNSWRIIGDRLRDDEFYLPDNDDTRSMALGQEWARRRGMQLVRQFALGGVAQVSGTVTTTATKPGQFNGTLVLDSGQLMGVVRGEIREQNRDISRRAGAGVGRGR